MDIGRWIRRIDASALVVAFVSGCFGGATPTAAPTPTATPTPLATVSTPPAATPSAIASQATTTPSPSTIEAFSPFEDSSVGCSIGAVTAARSNGAPFEPLTDCREPAAFSTQVKRGGYVTTDPCGQAVLDSKCGMIYVFHDSELQFSRCSKETATSPGGCLADGTLAWNNTCSGDVAPIDTPNASATLEGTWISATYLPDRQLSLFAVLDGKAVATPLDATGAPSGEAQDLPRDSFWFTTTGETVQVGGLDPRVVHPIEQIGPVVAELQLDSWMAAIRARADADRVRTELPSKPVINLRARGGPIEDERSGVLVQNALLMAMDWPTAVGQVFPDGNGSIFALIGDFPSRNAADMQQAIGAAAKVFNDLGLSGMSITMIVDDVGEVPSLGKNYTAYLEEIRLNMEFVALSPDDAATLYEERGSKDLPTIWLSTR